MRSLFISLAVHGGNLKDHLGLVERDERHIGTRHEEDEPDGTVLDVVCLASSTASE